MKHQFFRKLTALTLAACLLTSALPVTALAEDVSVPFDVATSSDLILPGDNLPSANNTVPGDNTATGENSVSGDNTATGDNVVPGNNATLGNALNNNDEEDGEEKDPTDGLESTDTDNNPSAVKYSLTFEAPTNGSKLLISTNEEDYNANAGREASYIYAEVEAGTKYWLKTITTLDGRKLDHYLAKYGDNKISTFNGPSFTFDYGANTTISAVFSYFIRLAAGEGGALTLSGALSDNYALEGASITLLVLPEDDSQLSQLNVDAENGEAVATTDNGDNTYTFTMPACPVKVSATFEPSTNNPSTSEPSGNTQCTFTYYDTEYTVDSGTKFFDFLNDNHFYVDGHFYQVSRDGGNTYTIATTDTVIEDGDIYRIFYCISDDFLYIRQSCDASELPQSGYTSYDIVDAGVTVTVTHNVNGVDKTYLLDNNSNNIICSIICLADTQTPIQTLYRKTSSGALEVVNVYEPVPLTKQTYLAPQYLSDYHSVFTSITNGTGALVPSGFEYWQEGQTVTFTLTPSKDNDTGDDYLLDSLLIDLLDEDWNILANLTATQNAAGQYTFTMPTSSETAYDSVRIRAFFTSPNVPHFVSRIWGTDGSNFMGCSSANFELTLPSSADGYSSGETIIVSLTPNDGYELDTLTMNGAPVTMTKDADGKYTGSFTMPGVTVKLVATLKEQTTTPSTSYNITVVADHGTVNVPTTAAAGSKVSFTVTAESGYTVDSVKVTLTDSANIAPLSCDRDVNGDYIFTMPEKNVTITVTFSQTGVSSTYLIEGYSSEQGIVLVNGESPDNLTARAPSLSTVTLYPKPADGYELDTLTIKITNSNATITLKPNADGNYTFTMPPSNVSVNATFKQKATSTTTYSITVDSSIKNGFVTPDNTSAAEGETVTLEYGPFYSYKLATLTVTREDNGQEVEATPDLNNPYYTFKMPASNVKVNATFEKYYTVTLPDISSDIASVYIPSGSTSYFPGETVYFHVYRANASYALVDGSLVVSYQDENGTKQTVTVQKGSENSNSMLEQYFFTMPEDNVTIAAEFKRFYTITTNLGVIITFISGATSRNGQYTAFPGDTVTFSIAPPDDGKHYRLTNLKAKVVDSFELTNNNGIYSFTMPENNVTITVDYNRLYEIAVQTEGGDETCTVALSNLTSATTPELYDIETIDGKYYTRQGTLVGVTTPSTTYELDTITVTKSDGTPSETITVTDPDGDTPFFTMPEDDVTVTVKFKEKSATYALTNNTPQADEATNHGFLSLSATEATAGTVITIYVVSKDANYELDTITVKDADDNPVMTTELREGKCTFAMPASAVTISATFKRVAYSITKNFTYSTDCHDDERFAVNAIWNGGLLLDANNCKPGDTVYVIYPKFYVRVTGLTVTKPNGQTIPLTSGEYDEAYLYSAFTMPSCDVTITGTMTMLYNLSLSVTLDDVITVNVSDYIALEDGSTSGQFAPGDLVTFHYTLSDPTLILESLTIIPSSQDTPDISLTTLENGGYSFTMPDDNVTVKAAFVSDSDEGDSFYITFTDNGIDYYTGLGLSALAADVPYSVSAGTLVTFNASADIGDYTRLIIEVKDANENTLFTLSLAQNGSCSFIMPNDNVWISAQTEALYKFGLEASPKEGGTVTVADKYATGNDLMYPYAAATSDKVYLNITPNSGYTLDKVSLQQSNGGTATIAQDSTTGQYYLTGLNSLWTAATVTFTPTKQNIVVPTLQNGSIDVASTASTGETVVFTVKPDTDYELDTLTLTDEYGEPIPTGTASTYLTPTPVEGETNKYSFPMPSCNVQLSATFKQGTMYAITVTDSDNGNVQDVVSSAAAGNTVTFTVSPDDGYRLASLTVTKTDDDSTTVTTAPVEGETNKYTFIMPAYAVTVTATFETMLTIRLDDYNESRGSIAFDDSFTYNPETLKANDIVTLKATPSDGFELHHIEVEETDGNQVDSYDAIDGSNQLQFRMPNYSVTVTSYFISTTSIPVDVTALHSSFSFDADSAAYPTLVTTDTRSYKELSIVRILHEPDTGYVLDEDQLRANLSIMDKITIGRDSTDSFNLISFEIPTFDDPINCKISLEIPCKLADGYHAITVNPDIDTSHGTVTAVPSAQKTGEIVRLTIAPDNGYGLTSLTVTKTDDPSTTVGTTKVNDTTYTFTMPDHDVTVSAEFQDESIEYDITVTEPTSGEMLVAGDYHDRTPITKATEGTIVYVWLKKPGSNYNATLSVKETATGNDVACQHIGTNSLYGIYSFSMPATAVTITATFKQAHTITVNASDNGTVTASTSTAYEGDTVTLTVKPDTDTSFPYRLKTLTVTQVDADGKEIADSTKVKLTKVNDTKYTFTMPGSHVKVSAEFEQTYQISVTYYDGDTKLTEAPDWCTISATEAVSGDMITITNLSDSGYKLTIQVTQGLSSIRVVSDDPTYTFFVGGGSNISVTIKRNKLSYTITNSTPEADQATNHGYLTVSATSAAVDDSVTLTVTPDNGYGLTSLTVTKADDPTTTVETTLVQGEDVINEYTFDMPDYDVTVSATFEAKTGFSVTIDPTIQHGTVTLYADKDVFTTTGFDGLQAGDLLIFEVSPEDGYKWYDTFVTYANNGSFEPQHTGVEGAVDEFAFIMPACDVTIKVTFIKTNQKTLRLSTPNISSDVISLTGWSWQYYNDVYGVGVGDIVTLTVDSDALRNQNHAVMLAFTASILGEETVIETLSPTDQDGNVYTYTMPDAAVVLSSVPGHQLTIETIDGGTVTPSYSAGNGKVVDGTHYIAGGAPVTLTPSSGYVVKSVKLVNDWRNQNGDNGEVSADQITINADGSCSFSMPDGYSTVTVTLEKADPTYTITIPASVSLNNAQGMTITASDVQNLSVNNQQITVQATSASGKEKSLSPGCGWMVRVNGDEHIAYTFTSQFTFTESGSQAIPLTIADGETTGKPAGTYEDTLTFNVSLTNISAAE